MATGGLVGYWGLDETSGTVANDLTKYGNTGTYVGSPTLNVAPPAALTFPSRAVTFNGSSQYVNIAATPFKSLIYTSGSSWIKHPNAVTAGERIMVSGTGSSGDVTWYLNSASSMGLTLDNNSPVTVTVTGLSLGDGNWHHLAFTYDGSLGSNNISVYVDGTLKANGNQTGALKIPSTNNTTIASYGATNYFNGSIDDVRIYNRALTSGEISGLYAGSIQPLAGAWSVVRGNPSGVGANKYSVIKGSASAYSQIK